MFQFPSNGKVFLNLNDSLAEVETARKNVSIPFKREGLSEPKPEKKSVGRNSVSIPFKREGLSELIYPAGVGMDTLVSIPFKREGLSEPDFGFEPETVALFKFQFPSNGKVFLNLRTTSRIKLAGENLFQFPSNGKVFLNLPLCEPSHSKG